MPDKKKLIILIDWFVPGFKAGGPIQSCVNICNVLKDRYYVYVLTTDTDHGENKPYKEIMADTWMYNKQLGVNIYYAKKNGLTTSQLASQIAFINADFIYLNHLFSPYFVLYPLWLKYKNKIKGKMVVCPRGALYDSALSLKSYKKIPLLHLYKWMGIHRQIIFHATNAREQTAIAHFFPGSEIFVADNLPGIEQTALTSCFKETGKLNCIFIARIVPIKNLLFLLQILKQIKKQIQLTIVGPVENEYYWLDCQKNISQMPSNITVKYIGAKQKNELPELIQKHHLFILPTTGENFGHSIFESLVSGRPVLISDQTPWLNLPEQNAGWDVPLNQPEKFAQILNEFADASQLQFDNYAKGAWQYAHHFIHTNFAKEQYFNLFK